MWPSPPKRYQLFTFNNLYKQDKNQGISSTCSENIVDLKILQSDWLRALWPISQKSDLFQIWYLCRNTVNNINFHYRTNSAKINDKVFNKFKTPYFWHIFPILEAKNFFKKIRICTTQLHMGFKHHAKILKKTNDPIPQNCPDRRSEQQKHSLTRRIKWCYCKCIVCNTMNWVNFIGYLENNVNVKYFDILLFSFYWRPLYKF